MRDPCGHSSPVAPAVTEAAVLKVRWEASSSGTVKNRRKGTDPTWSEATAGGGRGGYSSGRRGGTEAGGQQRARGMSMPEGLSNYRRRRTLKLTRLVCGTRAFSRSAATLQPPCAVASTIREVSRRTLEKPAASCCTCDGRGGAGREEQGSARWAGQGRGRERLGVLLIP